ncbi:MAG: oligosaccharide flippase family protein [Pseudomonadota bacterium]
MLKQWVATGFVVAVSMVLTFLVGRVVGPFEFGNYSYVLSVVSIFAIVQDGGFKTLLLREKVLPSESIHPEYDIFCTATGHLFLTTCMGLILLSVLPLSNSAILFPAVIYTGFRIYTTYYSAELKGEGRFGYEAFWQIIVRVVSACAMIFALFVFRNSIAPLFWAGALSLLFLVFFFIPGKSLRKFELKHYRYLFKNTLFFFAIEAATVIYFRSDIILLKYIHPESLETGYYAASYKILEGVILFITPVSLIGFRYLRLQLNETKQFVHILKILLAGAFIFAILFAVVGYFTGPWVINSIYGKEFAKADIFAQWLSVSFLFVIPNAVLTQASIALNLEKKYAFVAIFVALINVGLNFLMIPGYGGIGSVYATLISEGFLFVLLSIIIVMIVRRRTL